ncbi:hypothetical protein ACT7C1_35920 [Bacillus paranthracis]
MQGNQIRKNAAGAIIHNEYNNNFAVYSKNPIITPIKNNLESNLM